MRYVLVLLPLLAAGCADRYYGDYAYGDDYRYGPRYASNYDGYYGRPYYGGENCGTPYEPKACPPMPRRPLAYYPGDRYSTY